MKARRRILLITVAAEAITVSGAQVRAGEAISQEPIREQIGRSEERIQALEAESFSATTRMSALIRSTLGGVNYSGNQINVTTNTWGKGEEAILLRNALTLNYDFLLLVDTSTTGRDLLRTILRAANFGSSAFGVSGSRNQANPAPLTQLDEGFEDPRGPGRVAVNRLFYSTPINRYTTIVAGPRVKQTETIPVWPTLYGRPGGEQLVRILTQAGSTSTYTLPIGPGGGILVKDTTKSTGWSSGLSYVAANGFRGNTDDANKDPGGVGTAGSASTALAQISYTGTGWNISAAVAQNSTGVRQDGTSFWRRLQPQFGSAEQRRDGYSNHGVTKSLSLAGYWQPKQASWIPSISAGLGVNRADLDKSSVQVQGQRLKKVESNGWVLGLLWNNVLGKGNELGAAVGQPTFVTSINGRKADDGNIALEAYFKFQISDRITITPTIFYLSRPRGADTAAPGMGRVSEPTFRALGSLVEFSLRI